jgi:UTP-glucose-1-phosphate uridylyltransferase
LRERAAHRHAGHAELLHQGQLARQAVGEAPVLQLVAQDQVDAVVLRQRQRGGHGRAILGGAKCPVNETFGALLPSPLIWRKRQVRAQRQA